MNCLKWIICVYMLHVYLFRTPGIPISVYDLYRYAGQVHVKSLSRDAIIVTNIALHLVTTSLIKFAVGKLDPKSGKVVQDYLYLF